ncbi:MAG: glycosyltransferase family 2 protein [Chloroflexi bacterium]|nr:glycosyltransferase family 2 protein [Chloroflexota bacterium]
MQETRPIITAIIPTYRRPQLLGRAIRSLLNQTYPHLKVIVCDNASKDETAEVVAEIMRHDSRVSYHCQTENIGIVPNFNFGMSQVETPYFSILCDDDVVLPNFYADAISQLECYPKAIMAGGVTAEINKEGKVSYPVAYYWEKERYVEPPYGFMQRVNEYFPTLTSIVFCREIINEIGLFDLTLPLTGDLDYALRLSSRFPYVMFPNLCGIFNSNNQSTSVANVPTIIFAEFPKIIEKVTEDKNIPPDIRKLGINALAKTYVGITLRAGLIFTARGEFEEALKTANLLHQFYKYHWKALGLRLVVRSSQFFKPLHQLVILAYQFWKKRSSKSTATFDAQEYEKLAKYLEL